MRVEVYFNLHSQLWSVRALEGEHKGRVVCHASYVEVGDVTFKVSEAGRQRVIREGRKNVHAFVRGQLITLGRDAQWRYDCDWQWGYGMTVSGLRAVEKGHRVSYNPYAAPTFETREGPYLPHGTPVTSATYATLDEKRQVFASHVRTMQVAA